MGGRKGQQSEKMGENRGGRGRKEDGVGERGEVK